jgi:hypothetical protein
VDGPAGRRWLVVRSNWGSTQDGSYALTADTWFSVEERHIRAVLNAPSSCQAYRNSSPTSDAMDCTFWAASIAVTGTSRRPIVSYWTRLRVDGGWSDDWSAIPGSAAARAAGTLFAEDGAMTFRWNPSSESFKVDPAASTFASDDDQMTAMLGSPDDMLHFHQVSLAEVARSGSPAARAWLRLFLTKCAESPEHRAVQTLLDAAETH